MDTDLILKILVLVVGFYMAWNIGANDVANAMGTSVGSKALTLRRAVLIAAVLEFSGAFFVGASVSETMQKGLINTEMFISEPIILVLGMCGALLGTSVWLQIASYFGWPVSTTHAIVGAIIGFGAAVGGVDTVRWVEVGSIAASWILSPLLSAVISYAMFSTLQRKVLFTMNPMQATKKILPLIAFIFAATFTLSLLFNGLKNMNIQINFPQALAIAILIGSTAASLGFFLMRRLKVPVAENIPHSEHSPQAAISIQKAIRHLQKVRTSTLSETNEKISQILSDVQALSQKMHQKTDFTQSHSEYRSVEKVFSVLQILSACFVAFSHGANDVANAIGPVAAVLDILKHKTILVSSSVPSWLLALGGIGIVIGLATWGWRVIETIGRKITELTPTRGFCAEFGAATTILLSSKLGLPISTTHCLVGAVLGVGMAGGLRALNLNTIREIVLSWFITLPVSALMGIFFFYILKIIFI